MEYRILGPLEVLHDGEAIDLGSRQQRALLALLVLHAGRVVSTERALEALWPDDTFGKEKTLWVYISRLRSALEPDRTPNAKSRVIITKDPGYTLIVEPDQIDAYRFEQAVEAGRNLVVDNPAAASVALREALNMWRGDALADFEYQDFAGSEIGRLEELRLLVAEDQIDADLRSGLAREVIGPVERLVADHPLRERPVELQMLSLYRSGRQADALRAFEAYRHTIAEELGLEPSPELCRIEEQVLLHDARLAPSALREVATNNTANPFKGLQPFSEADATVFFGRDRIVSDIVRRLADDANLVTLVGASGSGKSSVLRAGLIPALRKGAVNGSERWLVAQMTPGSRPFVELEAALLKATIDPPDSLRELLDDPESGMLSACLRLLPDDTDHIFLFIDQFEELFTLVASDELRNRFIRNLEVVLDDPHRRIVVALALRADFYDQPLSYPRFATAMGNSVINVVPMLPNELEVAAEGPAAAAGIILEPALLVRLLNDVAGQRGALPLFQYALTEMFDQRTGTVLTSDMYDATGGVKGALARRAEQLYLALEPPEQDAAKQLFLRLVSIAESGAWVRRRVTASEILSIAADNVALQTLLDSFGSHRLLTFDRDVESGSPSVEVAHEALLREWPRLHEWIDEARHDVLQHARFTAALNEWTSSGEKDDYLLSGDRLRDYEQWAEHSALKLGTNEALYLAASTERTQAGVLAEEARAAREARLNRQVRRRPRQLAASAVLILLVGAGGANALFGPSEPTVAVVHGALGDHGMNDLILAGAATAELELDVLIDRVQPLIDPAADLRNLAQSGMELIIVGGEFDRFVGPLALEFPDVTFVAIDPVILHDDFPNLSEMHFATQDSSFLAGAAAARSTQTNMVGFVGGFQTFRTERSRTGFEQGVAFVDPDIVVISQYLGPVANPAATAGSQPDLARQLATSIYDRGADVIFHDAGGSGGGVLQAARDGSTSERHLWVIGSDADQYLTTSSSVDQSHILTSTIKRYDTAVVTAIAAFQDDSLLSGETLLGLTEEGVSLSRSGDHLSNETDGILKNLNGEIAVDHLKVFAHSLVAPEWQSEPDVVVELELIVGECTIVGVTGAEIDDGRIRVERDTVMVFSLLNRMDEVAGFSFRSVLPSVSLADLEDEAQFGIPTSYRANLGITTMEPGTRVTAGVIMSGEPFVADCIEWDSILPNDYPSVIVSPAA